MPWPAPVTRAIFPACRIEVIRISRSQRESGRRLDVNAIPTLVEEPEFTAPRFGLKARAQLGTRPRVGACCAIPEPIGWKIPDAPNVALFRSESSSPPGNPAMTTASAPALKPRLASLDQFRGYTVAGMFLVNFLGHFIAAPFVCRHHNTYCSYADTIMPQFFFAVGFSMRLSFGRRVMQQGTGAAYWHMVKRLFGLALVAIFISYQADPPWPKDSEHTWETLKQIGWWHAVWPHAIKNTWFQTLMHIAVTSLWILPVIRLSALWRILFLILSAGLHFGLSAVFNFQWVNGIPPYEPSGIDGGMLGFLSWAIPTLVGTLACDVALNETSGGGGKLARLFFWGTVLMALGWLASCATRMYDVENACSSIGGTAGRMVEESQAEGLAQSFC
jgi:hypothetical protein